MTRTRLRLALLAVLALALAAAVVAGVIGLVAGPPDRGEPGPATTPGVTPGPSSPVVAPLAELPETVDAVEYARAVALALSTWDTATTTPARLSESLLADADPTGSERNGLAADLRAHLPTEAVWSRLREYDTAQRLDIDDAAVPAPWPQIARDAAAELIPGTTAVTVTGTLTRTGTWQGEQVDRQHPFTLTVFVACAPSFDRCHLLRLGAPGAALD